MRSANRARPRANSPSSLSPGRLRIIGGQWRGRNLNFPGVDGLRPTGDRVRETLFNWLAPYIHRSRCLDLFAGSGALSFEALSRGAEEAVLIEKDSNAVKYLRDNLNLLKCRDGIVIHSDALQWLNNNNDRERFDLVFLDPPFAADLLAPCVKLIDAKQLLANEAFIYVETGLDQALPDVPGDWQIHRQKKAGQVLYTLFQKQSQS